MNKSLPKIAILFLSINLVACSTNTQNQNTTLGALTGGTTGGLIGGLAGGGAIGIGAGIVGGAIVGGLVGRSMDSNDKDTMTQSLSNETNQSSQWTNPQTGITYTVTPMSSRFVYHNYQDCRKFKTVAVVNGEKHTSYGIACYQNGKWIPVKR